MVVPSCATAQAPAPLPDIGGAGAASLLSCSQGKYRENTPTDPRPRDLRKYPKRQVERALDRRGHVKRLLARLDRLHTSMDRGEPMAAVGKAYAQVSMCGARTGENYYGCESHGAWHQTITCKHQLCPWCAAKRRGRLLGIYEDHVTAYRTRSGERRAVMVTLTQQNEEGETFRAGVGRLRRAHRKFTQLLRAELPGIGGITTYEASPRPGRNWHTHAHVLLSNCTVPDDWSHPNATKDWRPLNPWHLRALWAIAHLDRRTAAGRAAALQLRAAANESSPWWAIKIDRRGGTEARAEARDQELQCLADWAALCLLFGVPSVCDIRSKHPTEALKYVTKGYHDENGLSEWHLLDLVTSVPRMRRTDAWGALYHLQAATDDDDDDDQAEADDDTRPCPCCGFKCHPVPGWAVGSRPDWLLKAMGRQPGTSTDPPI